MSVRKLQQLYTRMLAWRSINFASSPLVSVTVSLGTFLIIALLWRGPIWFVARAALSDKDRLELIDKARGTLAQIFAGLGIAVGLYFTWRNLTVAREGQITERFTRAIDQLGSDRLEIRLGGIYALERIARDSDKDHWPIMEVLTAYVREHVAWQASSESPRDTSPEVADQAPEENSQQPQSPPSLDTVIQTILTVLGRRTRWYGNGEEQSLYLHGTDLRRAALSDAHLEGANLQEARGLTREQIAQAYTDALTQLPAYLTPPPSPSGRS